MGRPTPRRNPRPRHPARDRNRGAGRKRSGSAGLENAGCLLAVILALIAIGWLFH